jgi:PTS system nitrogen regulatory IIA component
MSLISNLLPAAHVVLDLDAVDKTAVFDQAASLLEYSTGIKRGRINDSLIARERLQSTGLGHGIAIPHGRVKGLRDPVGFFVRTRAPIDFQAADDQPVSLIFLLLVPEKATDLHLQILSELAQMFSDRELRTRLAQAPDAAAAHRLIVGWEPQAAR